MVDAALRSSQRMRRLISDLLLLARADAGRAGARDAGRPGRDRRRGRRRGRAGRRRAPARARRAPSRCRSRATPTSFTGWCSTCSRTACATRPPGPRSRSRSRAATATRCSRSPTTGPGIPDERRATRCSRASSARDRARRPADSPRLRHRPRARDRPRGSRARTAARSRPALAPTGGARFTVRLPVDEGLATLLGDV